MRQVVLWRPQRGQRSLLHAWCVVLDRVYKSLETSGFIWGESLEAQPGSLETFKLEGFVVGNKANVRVRVRGYEMFVFRKIWLALFSWSTRFEIRRLALLPTL